MGKGFAWEAKARFHEESVTQADRLHARFDLGTVDRRQEINHWLVQVLHAQ